MERPLYAPVRKAAIDSGSVQPADEEADLAALFDQVYVDPAPLRRSVLRALLRARRSGWPNWSVSSRCEHGLAELVAYLSLTDEASAWSSTNSSTEQMSWRDADGRERVVTIPRVTFARARGRDEECSR